MMQAYIKLHKKKIHCIPGLVILGITAILLTGCSSAKKDEQKIIEYLDQQYDKEAYTIQEDKEHGKWDITLKEYPSIPFHCNVFHDYLAMGSPIVQTDFREVFSEHAIDDFKASADLASDDIVYSDKIIIYSTQASSLEELKTSYDRLMKFTDMVSEKYLILIKQNSFHVRMDIRGIRLKDEPAENTKYYHVCEVEKGTLFIKPYDEIYNELVHKM